MQRRIWNGIWVTEVRAGDGATALVADKGAHVLSWKPAGGEEALFLSARSGYGEGVAIRGGVPIIFPQFNRRGSGMRHGFARLAQWRPISCGIEGAHAVARYALGAQDAAPFGWERPFAATYEVALRGKELRLSLSVENLSDAGMQFTAALHTYLKVADIGAARLSGLEGAGYADFTANGEMRVQEAAPMRAEAIDYLFAGSSGPIVLRDGAHALTSLQRGFVDAVVWNPAEEIAQTMADLEPGAQRHFVCIEPACVETPVSLAPGGKWSGEQTLIVD